MTSKQRNYTLLAVPGVSVVWLLLFYSFCLRVRLALGHWPTTIGEDGGVGASFHYHLGFLILVPLYIAVPISTILSAGVLIFSRRHSPSGAIPILLIPWLIWAFVTFVDPHGLYLWYLD